MSGLSHEDVQDIAEQVADAAFKKFFLVLGVDSGSPESILRLQQDFQHLRAWREATSLVKSKIITTSVWFLVTGALGALALYFSHK